MAKHRNINISHYDQAAQLPESNFAWASSVSPEDDSWCLFVPNESGKARGIEPQLWIRVGVREDGSQQFAAVGSPEHTAYRQQLCQQTED